MWFNGRKKMYYMNNKVIVLHKGLFTHLDLGFPCACLDVTNLRHSDFYRRWRAFITHANGYFGDNLGDHGYLGENMFIMQVLGQVEHPRIWMKELSWHITRCMPNIGWGWSGVLAAWSQNLDVLWNASMPQSLNTTICLGRLQPKGWTFHNMYELT